MDTLRTPDERFASLPDFPFAPHYADISDGEGGELRVHYRRRGTARCAARAAHARRAVVELPLPQDDPDPRRRRSACRRARPRRVRPVRQAVASAPTTPTNDTSTGWRTGSTRSTSSDATLVGQDWGGLIGLRLVAEHPERFARVVAANTFLPTGDRHPGDAFLAWQTFSQETPDFTVGKIVNGGCTTDLAPEVVAAYDAPFPDESYKEGARQFPLLVPISPDDPAAGPNRDAWEVLRGWTKPFLCAFSDQDPDHRAVPTRCSVPRSRVARASRTPSSRAAGTSSRRIVASTSHASSSTSSARRHPDSGRQMVAGRRRWVPLADGDHPP